MSVSESPAQATLPARSFSLRWRIFLVAAVVLVLALGLVGLALNNAYQRSALSALQSRMEGLAFMLLSAAELDRDSVISVDLERLDPQLQSPGSGIYAVLSTKAQEWRSPSSIGVELPGAMTLPPGETRFAAASDGSGFQQYQLGLLWQLQEGLEIPLVLTVQVAPEELQRTVAGFRRGLWWALGLAGTILLVAQAGLMWLALRHLRLIARDVAAVESGELPNLAGSYPDEIEPLARNLNRLLATEKANQERYRNALDSLAHSLKTPLAIVTAGLQEEGEESRAAMQRASEEMHRLITTRLQRAAGSTRRTLLPPVPLLPVTERLCASLQKVYSQKMIKLQVKMDPELAFQGESRDLLELLGNILDNAFKYGSGRIRVEAGRHATSKDLLWVTVEDDGPGIREQDWPALLERGVRGDERTEGHGLGLAIVQELLSAYGGSMSIGLSEWGGAKIEVVLPGS